MFKLSHKVAVVTGGASGIGRSIAMLFASQGAQVCMLDLDAAGAEAVCREKVASGFKASSFVCNVADQQAVVNAVNKITTQYGRLDILVNSAGVAHIGKLEATGERDFDRLFNVNVKGVYNTMYAVVDKMKTQGGGVILNLCSVAASVGLPDRFAYSMTKGAVRSMTLSTAKDYVADGIRCNCISPGRVHTPFVDGFLKANYPGREKEMFERLSKTQPIGRMGTPDEVAGLALYLCSDEAAFVTGADYPIDGGFLTLNT